VSVVTREQITAYLELLKAFTDTIRSAGPTGIPEGVLYAQVMSSCSLELFTKVIDRLVEIKVVSRSSRVLRFVTQEQPAPVQDAKALGP